MTSEKMTIHKALAERKMLEERIGAICNNCTYCAINKHSNKKLNGYTIDEVEKVIQGNYDKSRSLIDRLNAIMRAVTLSNAITKVRIGDTEYTVAEAIYMKNHGMEKEKILLAQLNLQYNKAIRELDTNNGEALTKKAEQYVIAMYGNKEDIKNNTAAQEAMEQYIAIHTYDFIDPLKIKDKIQALQDKISAFEAEVDAALSVSNALTEIEVCY